MSDIPSIDDLLGPLPTLDELLAPRRVELFGRKAPIEYFMEGWRQGLGEEPFGITAKDRKQLADFGLVREAGSTDFNLVKMFNEALILPTATAMNMALRIGTGIAYGFSRELESYGVPRDVTPGAALEAFPAGRFTGLPARPAVGPIPLRIDLDAAAELGVIPGRRTDIMAREAFAPEQPLPRLTPLEGEFLAPRATEAQVRPLDLYDVARVYAPEAFDQYDVLSAQRQSLRDTLAEMKADDPLVSALRAEEEVILGKVRRVEARLTKKAAERLVTIRDSLDEAVRRDSPEQAAVRKQLQEVDFNLRDLAPEVSRGLREARDSLLREEGGLEVLRGQLVGEQISVRPVEGGFEIQSARGTFRAETPQDALRLVQEERPVRAVDALAQRAPTIRQQVERDLRAAGRPVQEAQTSAALVAEHYASRAERLGVTPQELFDRDFPSIRRGEGPQRGMLRRSTNELVLFEKADASTFVHEMAHLWFRELEGDARLPNAPEGLRQDAATAREWMKEAGEERAQQERFARGFERYLMEGVAPSQRLARIFEQFKDWLTRIYQTVSRLRAPINDDIRGVYDRLLSSPRNDPVIVGDRRTRNFADTAEDFVRETPPQDAAEAANRVRDQRDRVADMLSEVVANARREARRGPERVSVPRPEGEGGRPGAARQNVAARDETLREGGNIPPAKGAQTQPDGAFERVAGKYVDSEGNINLDSLLDAEDIETALRLVVEENGFMQARRGVLSDGETLRLADELGMRPRDIDRRLVGEAFNAEQITAAIELYRRSAAETRQLMERAASGDLEGIKDYAVAKERHLLIMEQMAGIRAEAGRSLRAMRQMYELKDAQALDAFFQSIWGKTATDLQAEAALGRTFTRQSQLAKFVRETSAPKSRWRKVEEGIIEYWLASIFSGWETHAANIAGSIVPLTTQPAITAVAAGIGRLRGTQAVTLGEINDLIAGAKVGAVRGVIAAGKVFGDEGYIDPRFSGAIDHYTKAIPSVPVKILGHEFSIGGSTIRFPLRMLSVEDAFFKSIGYDQGLNVLAHRIARMEGLEGDALAARMLEIVETPSALVQEAARHFARYQTFQTPVGKVTSPRETLFRAADLVAEGKGLRGAARTERVTELMRDPTAEVKASLEFLHFVSTEGSLGKALQHLVESRPAARLIFPVVRTGINLFKYSVENSPLGFALREVRDRLGGAFGEAARDTQISRMILGSTVLAAAATMWFSDLLTDGGPSRPEERETWIASGKQPYSARIGETWVDFRRLSPLGDHLMFAADLAALSNRLVTADDEKEWEKARVAALVTIWRNVGDKLSMRGASDFFEALSEPERFGQSFINKFAASWVPNFLGQTASAMDDPVMREARNVLDALRNKIPWERDDLMPRRDRWGEPVPFTPLVRMMTDATNDVVNREMLRLGANPARPQRKWNGVELTAEQFDDYARIAGRFAKQRLDLWVGSQGYASLPDGLKLKSILDIVESSRKMARGQVQITYPELIQKQVDEKLKKLR